MQQLTAFITKSMNKQHLNILVKTNMKTKILFKILKWYTKSIMSNYRYLMISEQKGKGNK